jgi:alpha-D-ribose 1-methylphosphonate 5-triphosphate synthase subunit PhnH
MMSKCPSTLTGGFINNTTASQSVFRLALTALSRPAVPCGLDFKALFKECPPMPYVLAALVLTLTDRTTRVWLSESLHKAKDWLVFHRTPVLTSEPQKASFVVAAGLSELPSLGSLNPGSDLYPERSATVFLGGVLDSARQPEQSNEPEILTALGPGLKEPLVFEDHGLTLDFINDWAENADRYPLGVDVFLAGENRLAGLPRSLRLKYGA